MTIHLEFSNKKNEKNCIQSTNIVQQHVASINSKTAEKKKKRSAYSEAGLTVDVIPFFKVIPVEVLVKLF